MKKQTHKTIIFAFLALLILAVILQRSFRTKAPETVFADPRESSLDSPMEVPEDTSTEMSSAFAPPLEDHQKRITKKPFGAWITPATSPVQPEKFTGFHTGTDFEIFPDELDKTVAVSAICDGKIVLKKWIGGYGGVMVQNCQLESEPITVIYGHLDIAKNSVQLNEEVKTGQEIAVLAGHESFASDGERKHLHLGIHKGNNVDLRGYVDSEKELNMWTDFESPLPKSNL